MHRLLPYAALLILTACVPLPKGKRPAQFLDPSFASFVEASRPTNIVNHRDISDVSKRYITEFVIFNVPAVGRDTEKQLELEVYTPRNATNLATIIVLPISGGDYFLERHFARYFAKKGYAAIVVHRETDRHPESGEDVDRMLRQTVSDNVRVLDWICQHNKEFDTNRIGVLGTSLGSMKASLLVSVDPRIKAAVLGLTGGNMAHLLAYSMEPGVVRRRNKYMEAHGLSQKELEQVIADAVSWDPLDLAPYADPEKIFMFVGFCDSAVPFKCGMQLRRALGNPRTVVMFSGHYSSLLYLPYIKLRSRLFFEEKFGR